MNIVQLVDSKVMGGIETHILLLSNELKVRGNRVVVVFLADYGVHPLHQKLEAADVEYVVLSGKFLKKELAQFLKWEKPAVIHTHGYKAGIIGRIVGLMRNIKIISTFHSGDRGRWKVWLYTWLDLKMARLSRNIAVSQDIAETVPGGATVIPNFVELPEQVPQHYTDVVAFVGRLSHEKAPDRFIELAKAQPNIPFYIYGDGEMRDALEAEASANVTFFGMVSDIENRWKDIGLLCMPSRFEGLPLAALEAMAHGVPVLATRVGGFPSLITHGNNGLLCTPDDLDNVLGGWVKYTQKQQDDMRKQARKTIENHYGITTAIDEIYSIYEQARILRVSTDE